MARFAHLVVVDVAHHVTQRGNARQVILSSDGDRVAYFEVERWRKRWTVAEWSEHLAAGKSASDVATLPDFPSEFQNSWRKAA